MLNEFDSSTRTQLSLTRRLQVFVVGDDGNMYHRWQLSNGVWPGTWESLTGVTFDKNQPIQVIRNWHDELGVFAIGNDGNIYDRWQSGAGGGQANPSNRLGQANK